MTTTTAAAALRQLDPRDWLQIVSFTWMGMVLAISFLEAWVKFRAPTLKREVGLDVGRTVFAAFNKVEIVLLLASTYFFTQVFNISLSSSSSLHHLNDDPMFRSILVLLTALWAIISMQTLYMIPALSKRAEVLIRAAAAQSDKKTTAAPPKTPKDSLVHLGYIVFEAAKVVALGLIGTKVLMMSKQ